jgi:hypothetical protein
MKQTKSNPAKGEDFPREGIIKEEQFNPISKPSKLGYMMCKIKLYIIKYPRFINT